MKIAASLSRSRTCCTYKLHVLVPQDLVKMTTSAWLLQFQGSLNRLVIKEFQSTIIIYQPSHNSIKLQKVSTDTCQQVYQFIGNYPVQNWTITSRLMSMNWYMLASKTSVSASSLKLDGL